MIAKESTPSSAMAARHMKDESNYGTGRSVDKPQTCEKAIELLVLDFTTSHAPLDGR